MRCGIMSAFGGKADIVRVRDLCLLLTQSGHGHEGGRKNFTVCSSGDLGPNSTGWKGSKWGTLGHELMRRTSPEEFKVESPRFIPMRFPTVTFYDVCGDVHVYACACA